MSIGPVKQFIQRHYRHFNAASLVDAAEAYRKLIEDQNGKMMVTLAGAMSTAELGISLAQMIREDKVHAISCTGANLEEDLFNLVAHNEYKRIPGYRDLSPEDEERLLEEQYARVTDTCIPEEAAMRKVERQLYELWKRDDSSGERKFPHEYLYELILNKSLESEYQISTNDSWLYAAAQKNLPIFVPGWEDSTMGNNHCARVIQKDLSGFTHLKTGQEYMQALAQWYPETRAKNELGFFQIGGGIAGDFPICVVPMINFDLKKEVGMWSYFCQISDSTTSYGSYSGAVPNEKITWGKLEKSTPRFIIESDASIVAPLIFAYVLNH